MKTPIKDIERILIIDALERFNCNREVVSEHLGISVRALYAKIRKYYEQGYELPPRVLTRLERTSDTRRLSTRVWKKLIDAGVDIDVVTKVVSMIAQEEQ